MQLYIKKRKGERIWEHKKLKKRLYSSIDAKVSFPVVVFMNDRNVEKPGVYSYDFSADKLHMIENLEGRVKELINPNQEYNMTICFFLNLIQALALYGRKGYIRGLEEIGYLSLGLVNKYENMNRKEKTQWVYSACGS